MGAVSADIIAQSEVCKHRRRAPKTWVLNDVSFCFGASLERVPTLGDDDVGPRNTPRPTGADTPTGEDEMRSIARASIAGRKASRTLGCGWVGEGAS